MDAQKVGFTPRPIRYGSPSLHVSSSAAWNLHTRAELETCNLGEPYPRSMPKPYHFWPQITPSGIVRDGSYGLLRRPIRFNTLLIRNTRIIRKCIYAILGGTRGLAPTTLQQPRIVPPASRTL